MNQLKRTARFLALGRNTSVLLVVMVVAGTGERLWLGFIPKYLEVLGASVLVIGIFDALQTFLGAIYSYPGGWATDHWGQKRSLVAFTLISIWGYVLILFWEHWLAVLLGSVFFLAWSALSLPALLSVVATSLSAQQHTMGVGVQSLVRRVPMIIGPLIGGWLVTWYGWRAGMRYALVGCIALNAAGVLLQMLFLQPAPREMREKASFRRICGSFTPVLRELLVSDILIRFCERLPYAYVVLWAMDRWGLSAQQYSWLVAIEMITAMACYIPVAHLADKYGRRPFVLVTFVFFTAFPLSLIWASTFWGLAGAFALRGLKEFGEPARKALILAEADPAFRGRTYGAYYLIRDCIVTAGSFLGAALWKLSPTWNFLSASLLGALGTIWFWSTVYRQDASPGSLLAEDKS